MWNIVSSAFIVSISSSHTSPTETNPVPLLHQRASWGCFFFFFFVQCRVSLDTRCTCEEAIHFWRLQLQRLETEEEGGRDADTLESEVLCQNFKSIPDHLQTPASKHGFEKHTFQTAAVTQQWNISGTASIMPSGDSQTRLPTYIQKHMLRFLCSNSMIGRRATRPLIDLALYKKQVRG